MNPSDREIQIEQKIIDLSDKGLTQFQIAQRLGVPESRVGYALELKNEMKAIQPNGNEDKDVVEEPKVEDPKVEDIKTKRQQLWNSIIDRHNNGLTQKEIAKEIGKSQSYVAKVIRDIRRHDPSLLKDNKRSTRGRKRYTKEQKEELTDKSVDLYNSGMTVEEVAGQLGKPSSSIERWISEARKQGKYVRPSKLKRDAPKTDKDELLTDIVESVKMFANGQLLLGKHIQRMLEVLDKKG